MAKPVNSRGGSSGKVVPQKVTLVPKVVKPKVSYNKAEHFKRDSRHVIHPAKSNSSFKYTHTDINHTDTQGKVTRSINLRGTH